MTELALSLKLAAWTTLLLVPAGLVAGRLLARSSSGAAPWIDAALLLPLVLPPTVLGYYLLVALAPGTALGDALGTLVGGPVTFAFPGLLIASLAANVPFAVAPLREAFRALPAELSEAARTSGLGPVATLWRIELPLVWPALVGTCALVFAHTLGEFGVVLMVGGNIDGVTRTVSIAIYDAVQGLDDAAAARWSALLVGLSLVCLALVRLGAPRGARTDAENARGAGARGVR